MLLVQDQYRQSGRKNYETELQLKQDTTKHLFSDPKDIWEIESGCEEVVTSGNDSDQEENVFFGEPSELPEETLETRRPINAPRKKFPKNVRFEGSDFNYVLDTSEASSLENEYLGIDHGYGENEVYKMRRSVNPEPEITHKGKDHLRSSHKTKWRTAECGFEKKFAYERRPQSSPEKSSNFPENSVLERRPFSLGERSESLEARHRLRRKEHRCGRSHHDVDHGYGEMPCRNISHKPYKFDYDEPFVRQRHGDCDHCQEEEGRMRLDKKKNYCKVKSVPTSSLNHKHSCQMIKDSMENETLLKVHKKSYKEPRMPQENHFDSQSFAYRTTADRYCQAEEYCDHVHPSKAKKKILEAVQEQQEQFSDSTYKIPCPKYSSQTISGELSMLQGKRSLEKMTNSSQSDWLNYGGKSMSSSLGEKLTQPVRIHKMRSKRTRMNRLKNGWKKAFVQTVRDGNGNERVGVIVMGSRGPEFYSKNVKKSCGFIPFRKSKSFLDRAVKSFEVMTVDCKNVFLSSSEPGPRTNSAINELECPVDDTKVEEKIAKFSKNVNDIVKSTEEKFYKALSNNEFQSNNVPAGNIFKGAGEGNQKDDQKVEEKAKNTTKIKQSPFLSFESLTPRIPKSFRKPQKQINEDSKAMADALNKQAKEFKENPLNLKDREETFLQELKELQEKYPAKEISPETAEANLSLWGMKLDVSEETALETKSELKVEENEVNNKKIENKLEGDGKSERDTEDKEKTEKEEMNETDLVQSTEQKQRRKKYYDTTTTGSRTPTSKLRDNSCAGDAPNLGKAELTPKTIKRSSKVTKWTNSLKDSYESQINEIGKDGQDPDRSTISAVFKDLVENGSAISQGESENLQSIFSRVTYNAEACSNDRLSSSSSEIAKAKHTVNVTPRSPKSPTSEGDKTRGIVSEIKRFEGKQIKNRMSSDEEEEKSEKEDENEIEKKVEDGELEVYLEEESKRKVSKMNTYYDEKMADSKASKKESKHREGKLKKKIINDDKMRLLREALPSIAAENEAAHLKQLKKYIDRFIDRVEASTASEFRKRKENQLRATECLSTESSEVRVDARKILDFVSNPFKKISSDVTINIARKLTDALVQEKCSKSSKRCSRKHRKNSENETEGGTFVLHETPPGSDVYEEPEPTYLKQLKRMRSEHLNNILLEVKRLSELLRFLDRCNRLTF